LDDEEREQPGGGMDGDYASPDSGLSLIPTQKGFIEFSVKLLEARMVARTAMKAPPKKSALESASVANTTEIANEILNEMQRERGGDKVVDDMSRYEVTVRRPGVEGSWTGEVIGPPKLFPLQTVNVLAAHKMIIVLDQNNKKVWQNSLNYNITADWTGLDEETAIYGLGPCVERKGSLYVFDEGVLTAFDLSNGNARWRLPSVGITGLFFDDEDMIYMNATTASHDKLKYSRQIDISANDVSVVLKVDSRDGKTLWSTELGGLVNYVSGKYVFMVQSYTPEEEDEESPYKVDTGFEKSPYLRIRRINPKNGREMWQHFQQRAPLDLAFDKNTIRLVFKKEVQVLKFLSF
ncbi:MAG TPA: hypothetical protein VEC99_08230, partial [Clostridia bacterium]|nr:hypothetical protein [Clostridia bacterium]